MDDSGQPHCLFLEGQFAVGGGLSPSGIYDPTANVRTLQLGTDHAAPTAQMASLHETFHAFLNASTTFGAAMILAGALADAGMSEFKDLVGRLVGESRTVHETYATLAALYAAAGGRFDRELLAGYRRYHGYFDATAAVIDLDRRPILASIVLDTAAHAAMQTDLLVRWRELDCRAWPDTVPSPGPTPDERFDALADRATWSRSTDALAEELHRQGGPAGELLDPALSPEGALARLRGLEPAAREAMQRAAFSVFAEALEAGGFGRCGFDDPRRLAPTLFAQVEAFAGDRLKTRFVSPADSGADLEAVWTDYRRERLDLRPTPDRGLIAGLAGQDPEVLEAFTHRRQGPAYLQLVAMPAAKIDALYRLTNSTELRALPARTILTALRCRNEDAAGSIMLLLSASDPDQVIEAQQQLSGVAVRAVVTTSALAEPEWRDAWLAALGGPLAVLIDTDPFELLEALSAQTIRIGRLGLQSQVTGEPARIDVLVLNGLQEPEAVFFTPCSGALMKALLAFGRARGWPLEETDGHVKAYQDLLLHAVSHTVREERRFGFRFWEEASAAG